MEQQQQENTTSYTSVPEKDASFLIYRTDPTPLIRKLYDALSGTKLVTVKNENGDYVDQRVIVSEKLLNEEGQQAILNWFEAIVNTSTVQANLREDVYWNSVADYREQIAQFLFINYQLWEVKDHTFDLIVESTLNTIRLFITRTIDNKERDSYQNVYKETISQQTGGKLRL